MAGEVRVVYRKHDSSLHWHDDPVPLRTSRDLDGAAQPTVMRKGDGPLVTLEYASVIRATPGGPPPSTTCPHRPSLLRSPCPVLAEPW
jgi:hypothetical protein